MSNTDTDEELNKYIHVILHINSSPHQDEDMDRSNILTLENFEEHLYTHMCKFPESSKETNSFDYVVNCYERFYKTKNKLSGKQQQSIADLLCNYGKLIISNPEILSVPVNLNASIYRMFPLLSLSDRNFIITLINSMTNHDDITTLINLIIKACLKITCSTQIPTIAVEQIIDSIISLIKESLSFTEEFITQLSIDGKHFSSQFENNLIGNLCFKSCLPSLHFTGLAFPTDCSSLVDLNPSSLLTQFQTALDKYTFNVFSLFRHMLSYPTCRNKIITWLSNAIKQMQFKGQDQSMLGSNYLSKLTGDGAICNLLVILLNLAMPICKTASISKVDHHYALCRHCQLDFLKEETMICPSDTPVPCRCTDDNLPSFSTNCFYLSHVCIHLSLRRLLRIYKSISNELLMTQDMMHTWRDNFGQHPLFEQVDKRFKESSMARNHILITISQPNLTKMLLKFISFTCEWLLNKKDNLTSIPELVVDNISTLISLLDSCGNIYLLEQLDAKFYPYLKCMVTFMGKDSLIRNPHLKANLAQSLKECLPRDFENKTTRDECLKMLKADDISIVKAILHVFVTIEQTGQSVSFEEKFQYRVSLHYIIAYLYEHKSQYYRNEFQESAHFAFKHMDDVDPPIFLRFINLLLNDANYLMDESFTALSELREVQSSETNEMGSSNEVVHRISLCQYRCLLNSKTLETLRILTMTIINIFCHETIVDRIATMMNYFLDKLTGPEQKNLKIKDNARVGFNPKSLLTSIIMVMTNLGRHENFTKACAKDRGRYGDKLYEKTCDILSRINCNAVEIEKFQKFSDVVMEKVKIYIAEEISYDDAPEEFIDEITGELMNDPVKLPVSKRILDRVTITRHLLSDQSDPFNRLPLEIKDLIPEPELKMQIQEWKKSKM